ncbi:hypothetical protein [Streptomyces sp. 769]|uniref:hypothetical protein n=1 Tax=Streptomyces sp. 769 TaxID=1262452 RepID=UPI000580589D|nr:hypothetical protein [Streptomyces sp. 769]AJC58604.1 hypothetical protein GZL_06031 [Streptomyces sp. 769]
MGIEHLIMTDLELDTALADQSIPLAFRAVWRLLAESDVRLREAVALNVSDVELADHLVVLHDTKEGGTFEAQITAGTAAVLAELIGSRPNGPVFTVDSRRLRGQEAAARFRAVVGKSVHALRFTRQTRWYRLADQPKVVERAQPGEDEAAPA